MLPEVTTSPRDATTCRRITFAHARTFGWASLLLPRDKQRGAYAVYAFCRLADDIVDASAPERDRDVRQRLDDYRRRAMRALEGHSNEPVLRELGWAVQRFDIPAAAVDELLEGVARDLAPVAYESWAEVAEYCTGVASSVGEMCAAVFGVPASPADRELALGHARTLGIAMQLTNILRDVGEDAERGRCYLPVEDLEAFGLTREEVLTRRAAGRRSEWRQLIAFEIQRARALYREAMPGIALLARDARRCATVCAAGYADILRAIERQDGDPLSGRAVVPATRLAALVMRSWAGGIPPQIDPGAAVAPAPLRELATPGTGG
jgi:phytoene synthase